MKSTLLKMMVNSDQGWRKEEINFYLRDLLKNANGNLLRA
jgi:hypothetical protein